jgi:hypothetical protein
MKLIHSHIKPEDIEIYGINIPEDTRAAGYNIGDLLNMPHLADYWDAQPHHTTEALDRMNLIGEKYIGSILHYYIESRPSSEIVPNIPRIMEALSKYTETNRHKWENMIAEVSDSENLCVHIRNGDIHVETYFLDLIADLSHKYKKVYIISGLHLDQVFMDDNAKISNYLLYINNILSRNDNIHLVSADPDEHLCLMSKSANLLLHKGGYSTLGLIANDHGNLYVTQLLRTVTCEKWKQFNIDRQFVMIRI